MSALVICKWRGKSIPDIQVWEDTNKWVGTYFVWNMQCGNQHMFALTALPCQPMLWLSEVQAVGGVPTFANLVCDCDWMWPQHMPAAPWWAIFVHCLVNHVAPNLPGVSNHDSNGWPCLCMFLVETGFVLKSAQVLRLLTGFPPFCRVGWHFIWICVYTARHSAWIIVSGILASHTVQWLLHQCRSCGQ